MPPSFPDTLKYNLPKTGCDSHAHLTYPNMLEDLDTILERAYQTGIAHIGQIYLSIENYYETEALFAKHPQVFFTIGIHPNDVENYNDTTIEGLRAIINKDKRIKAIGEIGLDFYRNTVPIEDQKRIFRAQLTLAKECALPIVIHSRDSFHETLAILDDMNFQNYPLVWHCFCGNKAQIEELNARDYYIAVSTSITYPANKEARADLHFIPENRILIETDCPFLSPQGWRGQRNEPCLSALSAETIALHRNIELAKLWTDCGENAKKLFRL